MKLYGRDIVFTISAITFLVIIYLALSFFLQTRLDNLPISEMFSEQNISNSLVFDIPVILVALTLFAGVIWTGRKK